jgi:nucleotide-binding universal stress UspA family protein
MRLGRYKVVCLLSALRFHNFTTQSPHEVWMGDRSQSLGSQSFLPTRSHRAHVRACPSLWNERIFYFRRNSSRVFLGKDGHGTAGFSDLEPAQREAVEKHLRFARNLRIDTQILAGRDVPQTVVDFAHRNGVSQIFVARSQVRLRERLLGRNYAEDIVRIAHDLQVTVVADRSRRQPF